MNAMAAPTKPKVTVGVCGGVAAYRAVEVVRALQDAALDPHVVMTASAEEFVRPLTFAAVSGHNVISTLWIGGVVPEGTSSVEHIQEAQTTAALLIVPATANILGKLANGIADDFLTTLYTAIPPTTPVIIAPAMNLVMWQHPAIQANVATLRARGAILIDPGTGHLACGMQGSGRLAEIPFIVAAVQTALASQATEKDLIAETILITAGGTREPIDSVRFLGNRSSGKMAYALATQAIRRGARVLLVSAPTTLPIPTGVEFFPVTSADEMRTQALALLPRATAILKAAAVADFRPATLAPGKLHRDEALTLTLTPTPDIVAELVRHKSPGTLVIAFAAEAGHDTPRARAKLERKGVDAIVLNDISDPSQGFDSDSNAGTILLRNHNAQIEIPLMSKLHMASRILDQLVQMRRFAPADRFTPAGPGE